ncbi:MAG TPA: outer membrane beta-barrel protein [Bradyrhizobium sp.]|nr:outer membrane beta-barrel protein [Bradyrhizobium sp.]
MNKLLLGSCAFASLAMACAAHAADLAAPAPPPMPPLLWSWTGWYVGAHVGGVFGRARFSDPFGASIFGDNVETPGFLGGGQVGYTWQVPHSNWVFGVEADISGLDSEGTSTCFAFSGDAINSTCRVRPEATGTFTGRVGLALGPSGRTLVYGKGGAAWALDRVDMANNNQGGPGSIGPGLISTSSTRTPWGWTLGFGVEQALTPAWSLRLEYDYLGLGRFNVANLGSNMVSGTGVLSSSPPGTSAVTQNIQEFKVGLNYKWGADPRALWGASPPVGPAYAVKARPAPAVLGLTGWEFEGGGRYFGSWGQFQKSLGNNVFSGPLSATSVSRLTYDDMKTNSGEFFARIDTPWNVFAKGFVGAGSTGNGHMNDEDFGLIAGQIYTGSPYIPYTNTLSSLVNGTIHYGAADIGYDFLRGRDYRLGAFAGYFYLNQYMAAYGCVQQANQSAACGTNPAFLAVPTSGSPIISETDKWQALRLGIAGDVMVTERVKLSGEAAYLPYVRFDGYDIHYAGNTGIVAGAFPASSNGGQGVQLEALVSYYFTPQFSVGVGGRYWAMWTTNGSYTKTYPPSDLSAPNFFRGTVEQAGVFVQAAYRFGLPGTATGQN